MKNILNHRILLSVILIQLISFQTFSQKSGSGKIIGNSFEVPSFHSVEVGGALNVTIIQAADCSVLIEADDNLFSEITVKVNNGVLKITTGNIRNASKLLATITLPELQSLLASGASETNSVGQLKGSDMKLDVSGAATVQFNLIVDKLSTTLSGASKATLNGQTEMLYVNMSGAAKLIANNLETKSTAIVGSGASYAYVNAVDNLETKMSGAAKVKYDKAPVSQNTESVNVVVNGTKATYYGDTVNVNIGSVKIQVIDDDSTIVVVGNRKLVVDENGNVNLTKVNKKHRFNGHWAGFELGINGLLTPDFNMNYPDGLEYLDLQMENSTNVNLNFYEQNFKLNEKGTLGIVSGLGITWNNYRWENDVMVRNEDSYFTGYYMEGVSVKKSKLTNVYLTVPLFIELQSMSDRTRDKAHIALGIVGGWRFSSHTKIYFNEANQPYYLVDPLTGLSLPDIMVTPANTNRNIVKDFEGFQQQALKADACIRVGWGIVNLFANYSLTTLFIKDRGPELYPAAVGITLVGW